MGKFRENLIRSHFVMKNGLDVDEDLSYEKENRLDIPINISIWTPYVLELARTKCRAGTGTMAKD